MSDELRCALENMVWTEAKPIEYRVYYDQRGRVLCYTNEELSGDYIIVDRETWAANRYDWRVVKGKLVPPVPEIVKLVPSEKGQPCHTKDITIVTTDSSGQKWHLNTHED